MNIKHILAIALTALALGLAAIGVAVPSIAGGKVTGSDFQAGVTAPSIAGGHSTSGDFQAGIAAPETVSAGAKPGIASGANGATAVGEARRAVPRIIIDGSNAIRYGQETN